MKAVLFDFDGVISNTMKDHAKAWVQTFEHYGLELKESLVYKNEGANSEACARIFLASLDEVWEDEKVSKLSKEKDEVFRSITQRKLYPEIPEILKFLIQQNVKLGLVSGNLFKNIQEILPQSLQEYFSVFVTGESSPYSKPDPYPLLKASRVLKLPPSQCLVVENAPLGIQAAKSANMGCVAIETTLTEKDLHKADHVFPDHQTFQKFLTNFFLP